MRKRAGVFAVLAASAVVLLGVAAPPGTIRFLLRSPIVLVADLISVVRQVFAPGGPQPAMTDAPATGQIQAGGTPIVPSIGSFAGLPASTSEAPPPPILPGPSPAPEDQVIPAEPLPSPEEILPPPEQVLDPVEEVVDPAVGPVEKALEPVVDQVEKVLDPVEKAAEPVVDSVEKAVEPVVDTVEKTAEPVVDTVEQVTEGGSGGGDGPVQDTVNDVKDVLDKIGEP